MIKRITAFAACLFFLLLGGCTGKRPYEKTGYAMGSLVDIKIYDDESTAQALAQTVLAAITDTDTHLSATREGTDISALNASATGADISACTCKVLDTALELCRRSDGMLDITIGAVSELWGFATETPSRPADGDIQAALATVDFAQLQVDAKALHVTKAAGQKIDLGAFGKGAACDEALAVLQQADSPAVLSVGGTVLLWGDHPDGGWTVGLRDPHGNANDYFGTLRLATENENHCLVVSTSGSYEKSFAADGVTYHHILSPQTGMPAESDVVAVTVISESGILSDGLSTALFTTGLSQKSADLLAAYNAQAVFVTEDGSCFVTDGLLSCITITDADHYNQFAFSELMGASS